jgi:hypothetical protein
MQQGIQSAHAIVELMANSPKDTNLGDAAYDWAHNHKTIKMLSGGSGDSFIYNTNYLKILATRYGLPFAEFREPDIANMVTSVCMVVTPHMVSLVTDYREGIKYNRAEMGVDTHPLVYFLKDLRPAK